MSNLTSSIIVPFDCMASCISSPMLYTITTVNYFFFSGAVGFLGVVVNVIKVIIFFKLGFKDTTNISFFSLSVADTGVVLMLLGFSVVYNPGVLQAVTYFEVVDSVGYISFGWPYAGCSRVASMMTAVITVERFMCVSLPLKVRTIITPTVSIVTSVTVFCVVIATVVPAFLASRLGPTYNARVNKTTLGLIHPPMAASLESVTMMAMVIFQLLAFGVVTACTFALIRSFTRTVQWRNQVSNSSSSLTGRDKKLVKMVIFISVSFIVFSIPGVVINCMMIFIKEFKVTGLYKNLFVTLFSTFFPMDGLNSLVNFFIFLYMSTKFRNIFMSMFHLRMVFGKNIQIEGNAKALKEDYRTENEKDIII
ncbi:FMRFamide receptor [Biomphalaria glabrata]|nr:FMRFamide receptor-like [Biomphalaria glabrata]